MKVICIDVYLDKDFIRPSESNKLKILGLTLNKVYEVIWHDHRNYEILNDDGFKTFYDKKKFLDIAKWRDRQIDSILNDDDLLI